MKHFLAGSVLFCASAFAAGLPSLNNSVSGNYVEARTADVYTGPCFANSEVGLTGDLAVLGWKIDKGSWDGVSLNGLSIVGVVRAKSTLGDYYMASNPAKAILIVDSKASPEQALALRSFAKHQGGELLSDVVRVDYAPVDLAFLNNDLHTMAATLTAGKLARIETRALAEGDQLCHNEITWYTPLTALNHSMPAYTVENDFKGEGLGATWSSPSKRSAFVGSFSANE
jgi:hypothetical protein